jgi:hypothetical protein
VSPRRSPLASEVSRRPSSKNVRHYWLDLQCEGVRRIVKSLSKSEGSYARICPATQRLHGAPASRRLSRGSPTPIAAPVDSAGPFDHAARFDHAVYPHHIAIPTRKRSEAGGICYSRRHRILDTEFIGRARLQSCHKTAKKMGASAPEVPVRIRALFPRPQTCDARNSATERQKNKAHGVSRGKGGTKRPSPGRAAEKIVNDLDRI